MCLQRMCWKACSMAISDWVTVRSVMDSLQLAFNPCHKSVAMWPGPLDFVCFAVNFPAPCSNVPLYWCSPNLFKSASGNGFVVH
jgi:hypothetical protein